jgi:hypothetical protein
MGSEIILFGIILAIMYTVIGSATVYQAAIKKQPVISGDKVVLKRLTPPLLLQLVMGCLYLFLGVVVFGATIPVAQGEY